MSRISNLIMLLCWNAVLMINVGFIVAKEECRSNSDCENESTYHDEVCCSAGSYYGSAKECRSGKTCVGRYCSTDGDCGGVGECCKFKKCTTFDCPECHSNSGCATSEYCCKQRYDVDQNVCRRSCIGEPCHSDSDCGGPGESCDSNHECEKSSTGSFAGWLVGIIVVGLILLSICCICVPVYRRCHTPPRRQRRVVVRRQAKTTMAIISTQETQVHTTHTAPPPAYSYPPASHYNQGQDSLPSQPAQRFPLPQPLHFPST